ncbi:hypothetical protein [Phycicoccus avicenniae]|uniref:hypothetical protein n=1 Tax=Phycicoccus avicenniae TaxID=2828860 RepID=UPI003D278117
MDEVQVVAVAAMVGAAGAVLAQVVAAIATSRRDSKRIDWERQQWQDDTTLEYLRSEVARKSQLFGEVNAAAKVQIRLLERALRHETPRRDLAESEAYHELEVLELGVSLNASRTVQELYSDMMDLLLSLCYDLSTASARRAGGAHDDAELQAFMTSYRDLMSAMQHDLKFAHDQLRPQSQEQ